MKRIKFLAIIFTLVLLATFALGIPAYAQEQGDPRLETSDIGELILSPEEGFATITVYGQGFTSEAYYIDYVLIYWDENWEEPLPTVPEFIVPYYDYYEDPYNFTAIISVPTQASPGLHTVTAVGYTMGDNILSPAIYAESTFTVLNMRGPMGPAGPQGERVIKVKQVIRANPDLRAPGVLPVLLALLELKAKKEIPVNPAPPDLRDLKDLPVSL